MRAIRETEEDRGKRGREGTERTYAFTSCAVQSRPIDFVSAWKRRGVQ